jgi:hypothetical protein
MHHANAVPEGRCVPVAVDNELLQHLLDVSRNPDVLTFNDLITYAQAGMQPSAGSSAEFTLFLLEERLH